MSALTNEQIEVRLMVHEQRMDRIEANCQDNFILLRHEMQQGFDKVLGAIMDMKQEMVLMNFAIQRVEGDVAVLKEDVSVLKQDVSVLKTDVSVLKTDVSVLKTDVALLKTDMLKVNAHLNLT